MYFLSLQGTVIGATAVAMGGAVNMALKKLIEHSRKRVEEISREVSVPRLQTLIDGDEPTRDTLMRTVRSLMVEESERRRRLLCNYLRNVADLGMPQEDFSSKIAIVLNQITFSELETLFLWRGKITKVIREKNSYGTDAQAEAFIREHGLNEHQVYFAYENMKGAPPIEAVIRNVRALGRTYGLIDMFDTTGPIGPVDGINVKWLTDFGEAFLKYVQEESN